MPFGLRNAPSVFQRFIQDVLGNVIGDFVQVYLEDIIIYSNNIYDHTKHVRTVLKLLIKNDLYPKLEKCEFHVFETTFQGFTVSVNGLAMDNTRLSWFKSGLCLRTKRNFKVSSAFIISTENLLKISLRPWNPSVPYLK